MGSGLERWHISPAVLIVWEPSRPEEVELLGSAFLARPRWRVPSEVGQGQWSLGHAPFPTSDLYTVFHREGQASPLGTCGQEALPSHLKV
jgi:hypothetical protein